MALNKFGRQVLAIVRAKGPVKAAAIARELKCERKKVNSALYGPLQGRVVQDESSYAWTLTPAGVSSSTPSAKKKASRTPKAKARATRTAKPSMGAPSRKRSPHPALPPDFSLTAEQGQLVSFVPNGNLLIRGEAGSGKTTVLAARARWIESEIQTGSLLFLTYNRSLAAYARRLLDHLGLRDGVTVSTFHEWARDFAAQQGLKIKRWTFGDRRAELLPEVLEAIRAVHGPHRLLEQPLTFWAEEIAWIGGKSLLERERYAEIPRTGRGTTPRVRRVDRDIIWNVFDTYMRKVQAESSWDGDAPGSLVFAAVKQAGGKFPDALRYDHVFVDEVQDFDMGWLSALAPVARTSLTLAGDLAQRIYKRQFTWREVGIDLPPARSRRLGHSHRTTREIMSVAIHLATNPDLQYDQDYLPPELPNRSGPPVRRVRRDSFRELVDALTPLIVDTIAQYPEDSVVVALPMRRNGFVMAKAISAAGVPAKAVRGDALGADSSVVEVTTFHQAKGLEWDHVFLVDLGDVIMPGFFLERLSSAAPEDKEQELNHLRRLVYVAMTRARKSLTLAGTRPFSRFFDGVPTWAIQEQE